MRVLFFEKPLFIRKDLPVAAQRWPDEVVVAVCCPFPLFSGAFRFPRTQVYNNLPLVIDPQYKPWEWLTENPWFASVFLIFKLDANGVAHKQVCETAEQMEKFMEQASSLVCAADWDHTGALGFNLFVEHFAPHLHGKRHDVVCTDTFPVDPASLYRQPLTTDHPDFIALGNAGRIKRYFDYNFHLNGNVILGDLYRSITDSNPGASISKYMLLILFYLHGTGPRPHHKVRSDMCQWKGKPGSAGPVASVGSPASATSIIQNLVTLGLLSESQSGLVAVSAIGQQFLLGLHKDCYDPHLPQRITGWQKLPFLQAQPLIERYLKTFFGKQKRYQAKRLRAQ
jgi:hypothetical protein